MLTVTTDQSEGISGADIPEQAVKKMLACVASVSNRVIARKLERKQKARKRLLRWLKKCVQAPPPCLSPTPARFSHFFLLNDFSPLSRSLEQATDEETNCFSQ